MARVSLVPHFTFVGYFWEFPNINITYLHRPSRCLETRTSKIRERLAYVCSYLFCAFKFSTLQKAGFRQYRASEVKFFFGV